jgi:hypothetical protein
VLYREPEPCAGLRETPRYSVEFVIPEARPPVTRGAVAPGAACLARWPALAAPMAAAEAQLRRLRSECRP